MTPAKRRRKLPHARRTIQLVLSVLVLLVLLYGFVDNTRVALDLQAHAPPGAEHPYDFYAEGCLGGAMIVLAVLFLSRPTPRRWRKAVAGRRQNQGLSVAAAAKRRRGSGYNKRT